MNLRPMQFALLVLLLLTGHAHSSDEEDDGSQAVDAPEHQSSETHSPDPEDNEAQEHDAEPEERPAIEDIIPSEMISEDLAVDFPIDI